MVDYETGYKKRPKHSQFKPGNRANPHGHRGKKEPRTAAEIFNEVMNEFVEYREGGKAKRAPRIDSGQVRTLRGIVVTSTNDPKRTSSCGSAVRAETKRELKA
jgi:hypothetical protein